MRKERWIYSLSLLSNVRTYGARTDGRDCTPAFQTAIGVMDILESIQEDGGLFVGARVISENRS